MVDEDEPPKLFRQGGRNGEPIPYLAIPYQQEVVKGRCAYGGFTVEARIRWCLDCSFNEQRDNPQTGLTVDLRGTQHDWRDEVPPESAVDDPRGALLATAHATSIFEYRNGSVSEGHHVDATVTIHTLYLCDGQRSARPPLLLRGPRSCLLKMLTPVYYQRDVDACIR